MARTEKQQRVCTTEDRIALVLDIDEAFVAISERTHDKRITDEVEVGRSFARRLWESLVGERQALGKRPEKPNDQR